MRLLITHDPSEPQLWQLGRPPQEFEAYDLIGWESDDIEGGVPISVINVFAKTLAKFGRITFACSNVSAPDIPGWHEQGGDFVSSYRFRSALERIVAAFFARAPIDLVLLSTRSEKTIKCIFDDAGYPWWGQSQFALLSDADAPAPDFASIAFDAATLLGREWPTNLSKLPHLGVQAILRPGVDGDVLGLLCTTRKVRDRFETILTCCAEQVGFSLDYVCERSLGEAMCSQPKR
jgi:hypothetical protein